MTEQQAQPDSQPEKQGNRGQQNSRHSGSYGRFFMMIGTSMVVMFAVMYLHSWQLIDHAWFSETRLFMTFLMGASMLVVMLLFMWGMYRNKSANAAVLVFAALLFGSGLWLVRSQVTVSGTDYMEGMIPHHSIAILTSERAQIKDRRVAELAEEILKAQRREIREMEWLIRDIEQNGVATTAEAAAARPVPEFSSEPDQAVLQSME